MPDPGFFADVMANGPEDAKEVLRSLAIYTHIGYRPHTGYLHHGSRLYGHTMPRPGKTHALTQDGQCWRGLCGEVVHSNGGRNEWGDEITPNVRPAPDEAGGNVECRRCRALIAKAARA